MEAETKKTTTKKTAKAEQPKAEAKPAQAKASQTRDDRPVWHTSTHGPCPDPKRYQVR